jgi:hypothetical protein
MPEWTNKNSNQIAQALRELGLNDAATPMGAIELLYREIREGNKNIEMGLQEVALSIHELAEAIDNN